MAPQQLDNAEQGDCWLISCYTGNYASALHLLYTAVKLPVYICKDTQYPPVNRDRGRKQPCILATAVSKMCFLILCFGDSAGKLCQIYVRCFPFVEFNRYPQALLGKPLQNLSGHPQSSQKTNSTQSAHHMAFPKFHLY